MKFRDVFENEVATNQAGSGNVDGIGVGPKGEPGVHPDKKKKKKKPVYRGILTTKGVG